jgi:hypothetical protein
MSRGPLEFVVIEFPHGIPGRILGPELDRLVASKTISLIDMLFVSKAQDGSVDSFELADRDGDGEFEALDIAAQAIDGLISPQDVAAVGEGLAPGSTAMIVLFEHAWVRNIRDTVLTAGGEIIMVERIPAPVVEAVEALAAGR